MILRVPHSWLLEYCPTTMAPRKLAAAVSSSGPSIDRLCRENGEWVYEVEVTTNRLDVFSVLGFAREVCAVLNVPFREPLDSKKVALRYKKLKKSTTPLPLRITVQKGIGCRRYIGLAMDGITVRPSPQWMQKRLNAAGMRPINAIVDITNYVMLELGQPLHAFDAALLAPSDKTNDLIQVRRADKDESFVTLDGQKKKLDPSILVIADSISPLALAGIKGGKKAEITNATKTIILESASFDPALVRAASRTLELRTDSSARFEKDLHPQFAFFGIIRAAELLEDLVGARLASPLVDVFPHPEKEKKLSFSWETFNRTIGTAIHTRQVSSFLSTLGFSLTKTTQGGTATPPFWRAADMEGEHDLVEEVARLFGYHRLSPQSLQGEIPLVSRHADFFWEDRIRVTLKEHGWTELMNYSMLSEKKLLQCCLSLETVVPLYNPLSAEFAVLRPSLFPGMLETFASNEQKKDGVQLFEVGTTYHPRKKNELPDERLMLAGGVMAHRKKEELFLEVKGIVETLCAETLFASEVEYAFTPMHDREGGFWEPSQTSEVLFKKRVVGRVGYFRPEIISAFGIRTPVVFFDLKLHELTPHMTTSRTFKPLSKYPSVVRDGAFVLPKKYPYSAIFSVLRAAHPLVAHVELFDVFENASLGKEKRSMAFHITYHSPVRTLLALEVDDVHQRLCSEMQKQFQADIRS